MNTQTLIEKLSAMTAATSEVVDLIKAELSCGRLQDCLATKQDLCDLEQRLLKSFGERVDPRAVAQLDKATDKLEKAVEANQPISG